MGERLLGPADVRALAADLGLRPTKALGQNFVIDANTVRRIVRDAEVRPDDVVLEVGPGLGSLTLALLPAARRVVAVELDPVLADRLPATVAERAPALADRLEVVPGDALRVTALPGPPPTALVANLPYNVAVPVVLHLLASFPSLRHGLVMVQAEVADRLTATPGGKVYGVPSVKMAWYAETRRAGNVGRAVFWPVPNVDSGLVAFRRRECPDVSRAEAGDGAGDGARAEAGAEAGDGARAEAGAEAGDGARAEAGAEAGDGARAEARAEAGDGARAEARAEARDEIRAEVFAVVDAAFAQRRKTLRAALAGWAGSAAEAESILRAAEVDPSARGESLDVAAFTRIARQRRSSPTIR